MKAIKLFIALFLGTMLLHTACEPNYDIPPATLPEATMSANTTILELKQTFSNNLDTIGYKTGTTPYIIEGIVVGNDISGNIYKQLMIQDKTAAITISVDGSNLYNTYRLGQKVVIKCTGMQIGFYSSAQQLGATYNGSIGRMSEEVFTANTQLSGWPDNTIDTLKVTIPELKALTTNTARMPYMSQLIELQNVYFQNAGKTFATAQSTVNQTVSDTLGNTVTLVNSGYSNFYSDTLPSGLGNVAAILSSVYSGSYQLVLVNRAGVFAFNGTPVPEPPVDDNSETNPYTITQAMTHVGDTAVWVKGYIVGCVKSGAAVVETANIEFVTPFSSQSNILLAATATEKNPSSLMPVQLAFKGNDPDFNPTTDPRTQLNLNQNPSNLGKQILIKCDIETYFKVPGIKNISQFKFVQ